MCKTPLHKYSRINVSSIYEMRLKNYSCEMFYSVIMSNYKKLPSRTIIIVEDKFTEIFYMADDFCKFLMP